MNNKSVCIVGCGSIGRHHVNSCVDHGFDVVAVDPRVEEMDFNCKKFRSLGEADLNSCSAVVVSTTSEHRYGVVHQLDSLVRNASIVLEKPLFVRNEEYQSFQQILEDGGNQYYINLPNYWLGSWNDFAVEVEKERVDHIKVTGSNWGMACNILHDISILMRLLRVDDSRGIEFLEFLEGGISHSKREGFIEVFGQVLIRINGVDITIQCDEGGHDVNKNIDFYSRDSKCFSIDLHQGNVVLGDVKYPSGCFSPPRASSTTGWVLENMTGKSAPLPTVKSVLDINSKIYNAFSNYYRKNYKTNVKGMDFPFS